MKFGSLNYNMNEGEGKIRLSKEFLAEHYIIRADILSDWISELTDYYNLALEEPRNIDAEKRKLINAMMGHE